MAKRRIRWGRILVLLLILAGGTYAACRWLGIGDNRIAIALDAGHGGNDPGATGIIAETALSEETVRCLSELFEADENYRVILCRDYGESKDLNERWQKAKYRGADLLLCIHGNSSEDPTASGFEMYPPLPDGEFHDQSLRLASLIADEISPLGIPLRGNNGVRYAYYQNDETGTEQKILADAPVEELSGCHTFAMVEYPGCPALLVEQGFVTSESDMALLGTPEGCQTAAEAYYHAICSYFGTEPAV